MNKLSPSILELAADAGLKAKTKPQHGRPRAKWVDLREALTQLIEARELARAVVDEEAGT